MDEFQEKILEVKIEKITSELEKLTTQQNMAVEMPRWITLELAAKLKGGAAFETYRTRFYLQPCAGTNSTKIGGKKSWKKEDVLLWLDVTDADLPSYAKSYGVNLPK